MARPPITSHAGRLAWLQLNAALDYLEANGGGSAPLADGSTDGLLAAADFTKLAGIAAGATANATDAALRDRATHTGAQAIATVTGLQAALDAKQTALVSATNIKTINGVSVLGSGDLAVSGGSGAPQIMSWVI